jgi:DNA polymerase-1
MQPWDDGRIHPQWKPWGTRTGRLSSSPNAQNWPKWLRAAVVAPPGRMIVGADFDQLELRIMAALSGDEEMIRRCMEADDKRKLEPDWDLHSFVGSLAFGALYTGLALKDDTHDRAASKCVCQTCKRKALRDLIKRVVYGLGYGAGDMTVLEAIYSTGDYVGPPITLEMIAHVRKTIFRTFPKLAQYREDVVRKAQAEGEIRSPVYHRRRIFPMDEVAATEILNYPIQSGAADIVNERTILLRERLPKVDPSAFIFAQVHDALYVECQAKYADAVAKLLTDTLTHERVLIPGAPAMRFTAAGVVSTNWKEAA